MAELKTKPTKVSVSKFLNAVDDDARRKDAKTIAGIMKKATGAAPKMWGDNIVGYGSYDYERSSGEKHTWFLTGFSPRKRNITLYIMSGFRGQDALMNKLGKHKTGKSCLYINKLADVDLTVLTQLVEKSVTHMASGKASQF